MNLLATSPFFLLVDPITKSYHDFTLLYKEVHKLKFVPTPTIECKVLTNMLKRDQWSRAKADTNSVNTLIENTYYPFNTSTSTYYRPTIELNPLLN